MVESDLRKREAPEPSRGTLRLAAIVIMLCLVAFGLRLAAAQYFGGLRHSLMGDEVAYQPLAESLAAGRGYVDPDGTPHTVRAPGYPFLLAMLYRVTGPGIFPARLFSCVLGTVLVPICFLLGSELAGRRAGLIAAAIAVIMPQWLYYSGFILTDIPAAIAVGLSAWLLIRGARQRSWGLLAMAGAVLGLSVLVRATSLLFAPAAALWLLIVLRTWRERIITVSVTLALFVAVIAPWMARNSAVTGRSIGVSSQGGLTLWCGNNPAATGVLQYDFAWFIVNLPREFPADRYPDPVLRAEACKARAMEFIKANPGRFAHLCLIRFYELWKIYSPRSPKIQNLYVILSFGPVLLFAMVQLFRSGWRRGPDMLMVLLIGAQTAAHMIYTSVIRYRIPVEPLVVALGAAGVLWSIQWLGNRHRESSAATGNSRSAAEPPQVQATGEVL